MNALPHRKGIDTIRPLLRSSNQLIIVVALMMMWRQRRGLGMHIFEYREES